MREQCKITPTSINIEARRGTTRHGEYWRFQDIRAPMKISPRPIVIGARTSQPRKIVARTVNLRITRQPCLTCVGEVSNTPINIYVYTHSDENRIAARSRCNIRPCNWLDVTANCLPVEPGRNLRNSSEMFMHNAYIG